MRIRLVKRMTSILDGQSLSAFVPALIYELDAHLALQLVGLGGAAEDFTTTPAVPLASADDTSAIHGGVHLVRRERRKKERKAPK